MSEFIIPPKQTLQRQGDSFSPVNDLFAPFFDVVFYKPVSLGVDVQPSFGVDSLLASALSPGQGVTPFEGVSPGDITGLVPGASRLALRSVGGGLQSFDPEGDPNSPLGQLVNYRANLQVSMLSAAALQATLTLTPPYADALKIVDHQLIKFGSLMELQWGYLATDGSGKPAISDKGLFRITQPSIKFGREVSITIGGFDILSGAMSTTDTRCCWSREKYECDLKILQEIIKTRSPSGLNLNDSAIPSKSSLRKRKKAPVIQADDDWTFFRRICRQNDVSFQQIGKDVILKDEPEIDGVAPKYNLLWYAQPGGDKDIPMISFETNPIMGYFAMPGSRGQRTICRDRETGKLEVVNKEPSKTEVQQIGGKGSDASEDGHCKDPVKTSEGDIASFAAMDASCTSGRIYTQPCNRPNQKEEIEKENRSVRRYHNTRASAVCPGVPGLIPQQSVCVVNVGETFSGNYRVMKVIHNIGAGYTMKIDLLRSASTAAKSGSENSTDPPNVECVDATAPGAPTGELATPIAGGDEPILGGDGCATEDQSGSAAGVRNFQAQRADRV